MRPTVPKILSSRFSRAFFQSTGQTYECSLCHKPRSSRYVPAADVRTVDQSICSRPRCAKFKAMLAGLHWGGTVIYETHHHHYGGSSCEAAAMPAGTAEMPGESSLADRVELASNSPYVSSSMKYGSGRLFPVTEDTPPPIDMSTKPVLCI